MDFGKVWKVIETSVFDRFWSRSCVYLIRSFKTLTSPAVYLLYNLPKKSRLRNSKRCCQMRQLMADFENTGEID